MQCTPEEHFVDVMALRGLELSFFRDRIGTHQIQTILLLFIIRLHSQSINILHVFCETMQNTPRHILLHDMNDTCDRSISLRNALSQD